jgi:hypothetical protein
MGAAAKKKPDPAVVRRELVGELVGIYVKHRKDLERADGIKAELKQLATDAGNFQEVIAGKGKVSVAGKKDKTFKGDLPVLDADKFKALTDAKREQLLAQGVVKIEPQYSGAFYGSVSVDLF